MINNIVWCVAHAKQGTCGMQVTRHARTCVHILSQTLHDAQGIHFTHFTSHSQKIHEIKQWGMITWWSVSATLMQVMPLVTSLEIFLSKTVPCLWVVMHRKWAFIYTTASLFFFLPPLTMHNTKPFIILQFLFSKRVKFLKSVRAYFPFTCA